LLYVTPVLPCLDPPSSQASRWISDSRICTVDVTQSNIISTYNSAIVWGSTRDIAHSLSEQEAFDLLRSGGLVLDPQQKVGFTSIPSLECLTILYQWQHASPVTTSQSTTDDNIWVCDKDDLTGSTKYRSRQLYSCCASSSKYEVYHSKSTQATTTQSEPCAQRCCHYHSCLRFAC